MSLSLRTRLSVLLPLALCAGAAWADGIPDLNESTLECAWQGAAVPGLMIRPDGAGDPFTAALLPDGTIVDATLVLTVRDGFDAPVENFPAEDLWIEALDSGLTFCVGGSVADSNTDAAGRTTFSGSLRGGGATAGPLDVLISGVSVPGLEAAFHVNSPDLNGDGAVNMSDLALFADDYVAGVGFRSDFDFDGRITLTDVVRFAGALGATCP